MSHGKRNKDDQDRQVFCGNISFDVTEEQLAAIFSQVGPVAGVRLKFDREVGNEGVEELKQSLVPNLTSFFPPSLLSLSQTGKPLGFGFIEFHDAESAASARRNLNNFELNGRRLRVDLPSQQGGGKNRGGGVGGCAA